MSRYQIYTHDDTINIFLKYWCYLLKIAGVLEYTALLLLRSIYRNSKYRFCLWFTFWFSWLSSWNWSFEGGSTFRVGELLFGKKKRHDEIHDSEHVSFNKRDFSIKKKKNMVNSSLKKIIRFIYSNIINIKEPL